LKPVAPTTPNYGAQLNQDIIDIAPKSLRNKTASPGKKLKT